MKRFAKYIHEIYLALLSLIVIEIIVVLLCSSCESRKDVFKPLDNGPSVQFSFDGLEYSDNIKVSLRSEGSVKFLYRIKSGYPQSTSSDLRLESYSWSVGDSTERTPTLDDIKILVSEKDSTIMIQSLRDKKTWTYDEIYKKLKFSLVSIDVYNKSDFASAMIDIYSYRGVRAICDSIQFEEEQRVSVFASSDTSGFGDEAVAYEYLFDGEIMYDKDGWENDDHSSYNANPGQAAHSGYYITSTPLTQINHVFQSKGVHTLAIRSKSSEGMWGRWTSYRIDIEKKTWEKVSR